jgi:replicative DNA helicase
MQNGQPNFVSIDGYKHISTVAKTTKDMMNKVRSGEWMPLKTSIKKEQDKLIGYFPSDQVVKAARTGVGKTAIALHELKDFADPLVNPFYQDRLLMLFDSYEMADWRGILRLISREAKISVKEMLDYHKRLTEERHNGLLLIADQLSHLPIYISTRPLSVNAWKEKKKQVQAQFPKHYIFNLFDHSRLVAKAEESKEEERISNLMIAGMELKNDFNMFNMFLSQMNRNIETAAQRDRLGTHLPVSSDIFGSDAVFQCADIVQAYHRPGMYGLEKFGELPTGINLDNSEVPDDLLLNCVLKNRDGWTGILSLKHNLGHNHIEDYPEKPFIQGNHTLSLSSSVQADF